MGVRLDRLRYEVFQNLFLSPMNTGSVRPAVATTPTACGIETRFSIHIHYIYMFVATTPTACGIETNKPKTKNRLVVVATTPTACGIETHLDSKAQLTPISCNNTYRLRY